MCSVLLTEIGSGKDVQKSQDPNDLHRSGSDATQQFAINGLSFNIVQQ